MTTEEAANAGQDNTAVQNTANNQQQGKSQAEIDAIVEDRLARDRRTREEALARELGMPLKDVKALIKSRKEEEEAKKSELEKLTSEVNTHKSEAESARLEAAKLRALVKAGADPDKIDALLKRVVGATPEEIEADVKELADLGLLAGKPATGATGAGNTGIPPKKNEPTAADLLKEEQAKGVNADPLKIIHLKGLIATGNKS